MQLSPELAQRLAPSQVGVIPPQGPAGPGGEQTRIVRVDSVEVGPVRLHGVEASVERHLSDDLAGGIIGLGLFER